MAKIDHGAPVEGRFDDNNKGYEQAPPAMSSLGYIFQLLTDGSFFQNYSLSSSHQVVSPTDIVSY
jgi:hypothetical protein